MKISVIIGVVHMILGIFIKASNTLYFGRYIDFFCEFLPQLGFMALLFGYMDFLIIYKWCINWGYNSANAPSVITTMINIPLDTGHTVT
jgi:V-type H+-transporting ATPase subunit a